MTRIVFALALMAGASLPGFAISPAQAADPADRSRSGATMQEQSMTDMLGMVQRNGVLAGAGAVCHAPVYDDIRACTIAFARSWDKISGIPVPIDDVGQRVIEQTWNKAATTARERQMSSSPPMSCPVLLDEIRKATFWESCQRLRQALSSQVAPPQAVAPTPVTPFPQTQTQGGGVRPQPGVGRSQGGFQIQ